MGSNTEKIADSVKSNGKTSAEVYEEVKRMICYNMLAPGQKLIYRDIAGKLNTSITPVVQALKGLERANLVRHEPNKGYFVAEVTHTEARELFQAREALETYCIPAIIQNLSKEKLDSIREAIREYRTAMSAENRRLLMIKDAAFHLKVVECSGNQVIYNLLETVFEQITLKYRPEYLWEARIREVGKEHRAILNALGEADVQKTRKLISAHIHSGREHIVRSLKSKYSLV